MKTTIIYSEITQAIEHLCKVIRNTYPDEMYLRVSIFTKDEETRCDGDPDGLPDYYDFHLAEVDDSDGSSFPEIMSETGRIYYHTDKDGKEGIYCSFIFGEKHDD